MENRIKALFYTKIKDIMEDDNNDRWEQERKVNASIKSCEEMIAISRELETESNYVKVVEKAEEADDE